MQNQQLRGVAGQSMKIIRKLLQDRMTQFPRQHTDTQGCGLEPSTRAEKTDDVQHPPPLILSNQYGRDTRTKLEGIQHNLLNSRPHNSPFKTTATQLKQHVTQHMPCFILHLTDWMLPPLHSMNTRGGQLFAPMRARKVESMTSTEHVRVSRWESFKFAPLAETCLRMFQQIRSHTPSLICFYGFFV